jgi:hypothetical protein
MDTDSGTVTSSRNDIAEQYPDKLRRLNYGALGEMITLNNV